MNEVKRNKRFTVILGNPPYSNFGQLNKNVFILDLLEDYKRGLNERKINLDDDFIKFLRISQHIIDCSNVGIIGFITSNTFLDGLTHRQMRKSLMTSFSKIYVNNLHGNVRKKEKSPDGNVDENVFEIQQGVCISILAKITNPAVNLECSVNTVDTWGIRSSKYSSLRQANIYNLGYSIILSASPYWLFIPQDTSKLAEYKMHMELSDVFSSFSSGIQTKRDALTIQHTAAEMLQIKRSLLSNTIEEVRAKYDLPEDGRDWTVKDAIADIRENSPKIIDILYRPFDIRKTLWTGKTKGFIAYPRRETMKHMLLQNIGLCIKRQMQDLNWNYISASRCIVESAVHFSTPSNPHFFPLYFYNDTDNTPGLFGENEQSRRHNLSDVILDLVSKRYALKFVSNPNGDLKNTFGPEDIFCYIYAILHSINYRLRYAEFLKMDFPRVPLPASLSLFRNLCDLGKNLLSFHLLETPKVEHAITEFLGGGSNEIEKVTWSKNTVWINKELTSGFKGIKQEVWNFHIGGYQICEKWLKDRKGRKLSTEDIEHYQKIIVALSETIRLMAEIDKVIEEHGGWPGAFQSPKSES